MRRHYILLPLLALAAPLAAEPGLPDEASVQGALTQHPAVEAARQQVAAAEAGADARAVGPHEVTLSGSYTRRRIDLEGEFNEFDAQISRAFRLPDKARLDRAIGTYEVDAAENLAEDVRHQTALVLSDYWWDWVGASGQARVDAQAVANYESALGAVERRVELGDAAELEADQARAALGTARLLAEQSSGEAGLARARLEAQFPTLALPAEAPQIPVPEIADARLSQLRDQVLTNSHEIAAAKALTRRASTLAERVEADRLADPSFGVRLFSERSGAEQGAGLTFSIPLGGRSRAAQASQAGAQASAAVAEERMVLQDVEETADADLSESRFRIRSWQSARDSLRAQMDVLARLRRGHELGEIDLSELLLGERMAHDAFRTEGELRTAAQRAITKLRIDSHELWLAD